MASRCATAKQKKSHTSAEMYGRTLRIARDRNGTYAAVSVLWSCEEEEIISTDLDTLFVVGLLFSYLVFLLADYGVRPFFESVFED